MDALETPQPTLNPGTPEPPKTPEAIPLLPPALLGAGAILWLWVLPIIVLLALNFQGYQLVEGNMNNEERGNAFLLGGAGLINLLVGCVACWSLKHTSRDAAGAPVASSAWWGLAALLVQGGYLWFGVSLAGDLVPNSAAIWIYSNDRFFYNQFAFAMLPLFWGITRLACARPVARQGKAITINVALAVGAPVLLFLAVQMARVLGEWRPFTPVIIVSLVVVAGGCMFLGLIRLLALLFRGIGGWSAKAERIAIVVFSLLMPMGGLWLNRHIPFPNDFQAWEVYALAAANAGILLLGSWQQGRRPLLGIGLLCSTLPFTLYFFVVFLPFLPISVVGVIVVGAGFLVLTPTLLLVLHVILLTRIRGGSRGARLAVGVLSFLLLPGFFTARGLADKFALNAALDHVYEPVIGDEPIAYSGSRSNLRRALSNHRNYKDGLYYPLLSDYYAWLVFDHLVLPDGKLADLENAFFGDTRLKGSPERKRIHSHSVWSSGRSSNVRDLQRMPGAGPLPRAVVVDDLAVDAAQSVVDRTTVVTLVLTLRNENRFISDEYVKTLPLPPGVFVNGFRLHINGEPVPGRITEKKTALWVYSMIRDTERRDPGLLFYNTPEELELRVFPVVSKTPSVVEIDFLVPALISEEEQYALRAMQDPASVLMQLGALLRPRLAPDGHGRVVVSGLDRLGLPAVTRERYLHLIVDRSEASGFNGDLPAMITRLRAEFPDVADVRVTLANYEAVDLPPETVSLDLLPQRGGFLPDLALARAIRSHRQNDLDGNPDGNRPPPQPVFVILTGATSATVPALNVAKAWRDVLPAINVHVINTAGVLTRSLAEENAPLVKLGSSVRPVVAGRLMRFDGATTEASLLYWDPNTQLWREVRDVEIAAMAKPWARATALHLKQQDHERSPGGAWADLKALVKGSRESGVMLASTSYIVVENAAQWRVLEASEDKKLGQNSALDFKEAPAPSIAWLALGFGVWLWIRRWFAARRRARA